MHVILRPSVVLLVVFALVLVGAAAFTARLDGASAVSGGPEMRLTANGCIADCTFANSESFTLAVEIVTAPAEGYVAVQSLIDFGLDLVHDPAGAHELEEIVWPDCAALPIRIPERPFGPGFLEHGCLTAFLPPLPVSTYTGNVVEVSLTCSSADSTTDIRLVPNGDPGAPTSGTTFLLEDLVTQVAPKVSDLLIHCGAGGGPEMRLTANGCAAECTFANSESFTLAVDIVTAPATGYVGVQSFIDYGDNLIYDIDSQQAADEIVWADLDTRIALRASVGAGLVIHGGESGLIPPLPVSTYIGNFVEIKMTCSAGDTSTQVDLLPLGDQQTVTSGTVFVGGDGVTIITPKVGGLVIHCGAGGPLDTPTPPATQTPLPTATSTPRPTPLPPSVGDVNCDGVVNGIDASLILQLHAALLSALPCPRDSDVNGDGMTDSKDAFLILQFSAGFLSTLPP